MLLAQIDEVPPTEDEILPEITQTQFLTSGLPVFGENANITCDYYTPKRIGNSGRLETPSAANQNFSFASSSCYVIFPVQSTTVEILNVSTTYGQIDGTILTNYFLFIIMMGFIFSFILKRFIYKK